MAVGTVRGLENCASGRSAVNSKAGSACVSRPSAGIAEVRREVLAFIPSPLGTLTGDVWAAKSVHFSKDLDVLAVGRATEVGIGIGCDRNGSARSDVFWAEGVRKRTAREDDFCAFGEVGWVEVVSGDDLLGGRTVGFNDLFDRIAEFNCIDDSLDVWEIESLANRDVGRF